jgi:hypothetical protein
MMMFLVHELHKQTYSELLTQFKLERRGMAKKEGGDMMFDVWVSQVKVLRRYFPHKDETQCARLMQTLKDRGIVAKKPGGDATGIWWF